MYQAGKFKLTIFIAAIIFIGCSGATDLTTPDMIGKKERLRIVSGKQAAQVVNRMHGQNVATDANVIAEYGNDENKDILYISRYAETGAAQKALELMVLKMKAAKQSPFYHLMPIGKYKNKVYMTPGMGAVHFIYRSANCLLWYQTYQPFGDNLPSQLLDLYPI